MTRALTDQARAEVERLREHPEATSMIAALTGDPLAHGKARARAELAGASRNGHGAATDAATWTPLPLADTVAGIARGEIVGPVPTLLPRADGIALVYPGEVHSIAGEPEAGKGWIMLAETARLLAAGQAVLYLDFEDAPASIVTRLLALGVDPDAIVQRFRYVRPEEAPPEGAIGQLAAGPCALVVIDGLSEAYSLLGLDYGSNIDVPEFLRRLARPLAANGAAVVQIDHVPKDKGNRGRYAIGGQHKLAGVAVAYGIEVIDRPSRTTTGRVKLVLAKDRHGHVPGGHGAPVALVTITPATDDDALVSVTIAAPDGLDEHGTFRPTVLMEAVSRYVEDTPGASLRSIRDGVKGNHAAKDAALETLVREAWITRETNGQAKRHTSARPYRKTDDPGPTVPTVPDRAQTVPETQGVPTVPTVPPSYKEGHGHGHTTQHDPDPDLAQTFQWWQEEPAR